MDDSYINFRFPFAKPSSGNILLDIIISDFHTSSYDLLPDKEILQRMEILIILLIFRFAIHIANIPDHITLDSI